MIVERAVLRSVSRLLPLCVVVACVQGDAVTEPSPERPEDRGRALARVGFLGDLLWSPDGREIFLFGGDGVRAVSVESGAIRAIDTGRYAYAKIAFSAEPQRLFFVAVDDPAGPWTLYSVSFDGSGLVRLAESASTTSTVRSLRLRTLVPSPDGTQLAYAAVNSACGGCDSIFVQDLATGSRTHVGFGEALAFSPDAHRLLLGSEIVRLDSGETEPISLEGSFVPAWLWGLRWDDAGISVLLQSYRTLYLRDATLDVDREVTLPVRPPELLWSAMWAPDGSRIGAWTTRCLESSGFACDLVESVLYVAAEDGEGAQVCVVARHGSSIFAPIFSPDGLRVAYVLERMLYVKSVP